MEQKTNTVVHRTQRFASQSLSSADLHDQSSSSEEGNTIRTATTNGPPPTKAAKRPSSSATSLVLLGKRSGEDDASTLGVALEEFDLEFHHHVRRGQTNLSWQIGR